VPIGFAPRRPGEAQESFRDVSKAERLLGWKPKVTLHEGLQNSFRWAADRAAAAEGAPA
jgi:nucleoside-diphosphate-sugar epimerase